MFYFISTPWLIKKANQQCIWDIPSKEKTLYLTFDDGPDPVVTPFVLDQLKAYNASATFFCLGKNVEQAPDVYQRIIEERHGVGNHTYSHLNGWKTDDEQYLDDILKAKEVIDSNLFRPPYGRITPFQLKLLQGDNVNLKAVMWSVLSGDFDNKISSEDCYINVGRNVVPGRIVVFHDSKKAFAKLQYALPLVLEHFSKQGYKFESIKYEKNKVFEPAY
jgi:peptidoglycan-N-acetylglucosamine deacetylase